MIFKLLLLLLLLGTLSAVTAVLQHVPHASLDDVRFMLWTRNNPGDSDYQVLTKGDLATLGYFNGLDPTVVIVHGFTSHGYEGWPVDAKTELLQLGSYNVISVDWGKLAISPWYSAAVSHVTGVGILTARLLDWLHEAAGMQTEGLQLVGHSLGAHVLGVVGQNVGKFRLPFITGMDPAGPDFDGALDSFRLDKTDANFVQIIHTNGGSVLEGCVGLMDALGHVDFFPNGGKHQPGCTAGGSWMDLLTGGCSHSKSHKYWMESINSQTAFLSRPCHDWGTYTAGECDTCGRGCLEMGFHVNRSLEGTYYLTTNEHEPFAQGSVTPHHYEA